MDKQLNTVDVEKLAQNLAGCSWTRSQMILQAQDALVAAGRKKPAKKRVRELADALYARVEALRAQDSRA